MVELSFSLVSCALRTTCRTTSYHVLKTVKNETASSATKNICIFSSEKNTAWRKHRTGNTISVAYFNDENLRVLHIIGDMPAYQGIRSDRDDTPIQISKRNPMATQSNAQQCSSEIISDTPEITRAANTGSE